MTKHIKNILDGARQVLILKPSSGYVVPSKYGFSSDARALKEDSRRVARDLNRTVKKNGK